MHNISIFNLGGKQIFIIWELLTRFNEFQILTLVNETCLYFGKLKINGGFEESFSNHLI